MLSWQEEKALVHISSTQSYAGCGVLICEFAAALKPKPGGHTGLSQKLEA